MLGLIDKALALIGIGGFYLYREYIKPEGDKMEIEGPYKRPFNPYEGARLYFFNAHTEFHLKAPEGAQKPNLPEIE